MQIQVKTRHVTAAVLMFCALLVCANSAVAERLVLQHDVDVEIDPDQQRIEILDRIAFPDDSQSYTLLINSNLAVELSPDAGAATLTPGEADTAIGLRKYQLKLGDSTTVSLVLAGKWVNTEDQSRGHISDNGVYLAPASGWLPIVADSLISFSLRVRLPESWVGLSQGTKTKADGATQWREQSGQPGIWLVAGRFYLHESVYENITLEGYFYRPDADLAKAYFDAAADSLARYSEALGPYPYTKLAIVENFWETGYGMPSFALLGSKVLRLPFIPHSAWPHEVLHNWFGNGVYPGDDGNWSEGLTAYLADHAIKESAGAGATFRRDALEKYLNYVDTGADMALANFRFRHSNESAAVGYDKSLMVFHMLRLHIGDTAFLTGLRRLVETTMYNYATWEDIKRHMADASGQNLDQFFTQWVRETGAPELTLDAVQAEDNCAIGTIKQSSPSVFELAVPVVVHFGNSVVEDVIDMRSSRAQFSICADQAPKRIDVDPRFDVFRRLDRAELPASIGELIATEKVVAVLPSGASDSELDAWRRVAAEAKVDTVGDAAIDALPDGVGVWVLGADNQFRGEFLDEANQSAVLGGENVHSDRHAIAIARRLQNRPVGFASVPPGGDAHALMRRLKHYGRYGYLAFREGDRIASVRGQWPLADDSPLTAVFVDDPPRLDLAPREPLLAQ